MAGGLGDQRDALRHVGKEKGWWAPSKGPFECRQVWHEFPRASLPTWAHCQLQDLPGGEHEGDCKLLGLLPLGA